MKVVNQPIMKKDAMALVTIDQHSVCYESARDRGDLYMGRCATGTFYDGRTDISGIKPI